MACKYRAVNGVNLKQGRPLFPDSARGVSYTATAVHEISLER